MQHESREKLGRIFSGELVAQLDGVLNALAVCSSDLAGCPPRLFTQLPVRIVRQEVGEFSAGQQSVANVISDGVLLLSDLLYDGSKSGVIRDPGVDSLIEKQLAPRLQKRIGKVRAIEVSEKALIQDDGTNLFLNGP